MRYLKNQLRDSKIKAVLSYQPGKCGAFGPYFIVEYKDYSRETIPRERLAIFLNTNAGVEGKPRLIDEHLEEALRTDYSDVITFKRGHYTYNGPFINKCRAFYSPPAPLSSSRVVKFPFRKSRIAEELSSPPGSASSSIDAPTTRTQASFFSSPASTATIIGDSGDIDNSITDTPVEFEMRYNM